LEPRSLLGIGLAFALVFGGDLDLVVADLRGSPARDVPFGLGFGLGFGFGLGLGFGFGFALPGMRTGPGGAFIVMAAPCSGP
jgi:hypothetical protein